MLIILLAFGCLGAAMLFAGQSNTATTKIDLKANQPGGQSQATATINTTPNPTGTQDVYVKALSSGVYDNPAVTVRLGSKVRFHFSAESGAGCGRQLVIPDFGIQLISKNGEEVIGEFTPTKTGTYPFRCGMNMFRGTIKVIA